MVKFPIAVGFTVSVEVPVPPLVKLTLVELREYDRRVGDTEAESVTTPVKLKRLVKAIVEDPVELACTVNAAGLLDIAKFGGLNGLSLVNLTVVGAEVPCTYSKSTVTPAPLARTDRP